MSDMNALADKIDPRGKTPSTESRGSTCYRLFEVDEHVLIAASDALRAMGWRPIGEAPKDGTLVILWLAEHREYALGFNSGGPWIDDSLNPLDALDNPTHFMPLPAAPEAKP